LPDPHELDVGLRESRAMRVWQQRTHDHVPIADGMNAEHPARIMQPAGKQPADV
jgi:hypothetical protein